MDRDKNTQGLTATSLKFKLFSSFQNPTAALLKFSDDI